MLDDRLWCETRETTLNSGADFQQASGQVARRRARGGAHARSEHQSCRGLRASGGTLMAFDQRPAFHCRRSGAWIWRVPSSPRKSSTGCAKFILRRARSSVLSTGVIQALRASPVLRVRLWDMLSVAEAASRVGRSPDTVRRWIRDGRLPARMEGRRRVIDPADLDGVRDGLYPMLPVPAEWERLEDGTPAPNWVAAVALSRAGR